MSHADSCIAIVVDPSLPLGLLANTVATIGIGLGAADPGLGNMSLTDAAGRTVQTSANRPVPILQAPAEAIGALLLRSLPAPQGATVVPFPRFARDIHVFADYVAEYPRRDLEAQVIEGLGLAGPVRWVKSLTGSLRLLR